MYTQWLWIDPFISLVIMVVILTSTWNLLRDSLSLSMDAVPTHIKIENIRDAALKLAWRKRHSSHSCVGDKHRRECVNRTSRYFGFYIA